MKKLVSMMVLLGIAVVANAGVIAGPVVFTDDLSSGISSTKTYTHLIDLGTDPAAVVNGVTFDKVSTATSQLEADYSSTLGFKYTMFPYPWNTTGGVTYVSAAAAGTGVPSGSGMNTLLMDFACAAADNYGATITLSGLTAGKVYDARIYYRTWDPSLNQSMNIFFDVNASGTAAGDSITVNESAANPSAAQYISYQYTAVGSEMTIYFQQNVMGNSWHQYGLTNELVVPEPATMSLLVLGGAVALIRRKK